MTNYETGKKQKVGISSSDGHDLQTDGQTTMHTNGQTHTHTQSHTHTHLHMDTHKDTQIKTLTIICDQKRHQ